MKKLFIIIAILMASASSIGAQEAFKHLGAGLEVGTTGVGLEISFPLVSNHLVVKGGYNFPSISYGRNFSYSISSVNNEIEEANATLLRKGVPASELLKTRFTDPETLSMNAKADLGAAKLMLEYYPSEKSSFHITAGLYIGTGDFLSVSANTSASFMTSFDALGAEADALKEKYGHIISEFDKYKLEDLLKYNIGSNTYFLAKKDGKGRIEAALSIARVRPYLGIGFGRSIPRTRLGFQFDLGVWYHGKPTVAAVNPVTYDSSAPVLVDQKSLDLIGKIAIYPQVSFRLTCRLF